jgi:hypothetical protein
MRCSALLEVPPRPVANAERTALRAPVRTLPWSWVEASLCGLAIGLGIFLRLYRFWAPSLWLDELATAHVASAPGWTTLLERSRLALDPPLHEVVARFFLLFGRTEFSLRLPSVLFGLGAIAVLMLCLRRVVGMRGAWYAGALFALNSRAILHGQDARMYSLALLLALLSTYALVRVIEGAGRLWLAAYVATACLQSYNHIIYTSVLAAQIAVVLGLFWFARERPRGLARVLVAQALALALLAPLTPLVLAVGALRNKIYGFWTAPPDWAWLRDFLEWPEVSFALVTIPGLTVLWHRRKQLRTTNPAQQCLLGLGIVYAAMWPAAVLFARLKIVNILQARYLLPSLLGLLILAGFCLAKVNEPALRVTLCLYIAFAMYFQVLVAKKFGPWVGILPNQDWRAADRWIEGHYRPGDVVLLRSGFATLKGLTPDRPGAQEFLSCPLTGFYSHRPLKVYNLPWEASDLSSSPFTPPAVQSEVRQARRIFVLVNPQRDQWDWKALERWIGPPGHSLTPVEKLHFAGLRLRIYERPGTPSDADSTLSRSGSAGPQGPTFPDSSAATSENRPARRIVASSVVLDRLGT